MWPRATRPRGFYGASAACLQNNRVGAPSKLAWAGG